MVLYPFPPHASHLPPFTLKENLPCLLYTSFQIGADYYRIFTWKGYEGKDLATTDPLYLNAQGDKGNASLLVLNARFSLALSNWLNLDFNVSNYWRDTQDVYKRQD